MVKKGKMENGYTKHVTRRYQNHNTGAGLKDAEASNAFSALYRLRNTQGFQGLTRNKSGSVTLRFNRMPHLETHLRKLQRNLNFQSAVEENNSTYYVKIPPEYVQKLNLAQNVNNKGASKWNRITRSIPPQYQTVFNQSMALVYAQHLQSKPERVQELYFNSIGQLIPGMIEYFDRLL